MTESLPAVNAAFNFTSMCLLIAGLVFIKQGNQRAHIACMVGALTASALFLAGYLTYHYFHGSTRFPDIGFIRTVYLGILLTHTVLAVVILPFVFVVVVSAARGRFERHKRVARWLFPMWLYVSGTGVLIYFMLYHWFRPVGIAS